MAAMPPELMEIMAGGGGTSTAPGPNPISADAAGNAAPAGGPMTTPQPKEGVTQAAMVNISMVFQLLEQSLAAFGSQSEEGKAILSALKMLTSKFGNDRQKADSLIPAELMMLLQTIPGAGGGSPAAKAMGGIPPQSPAMPG